MDALLEPGLVVEIVLDGGWRRPAAVLAASPGSVELAPMGEPLVLPGQLDWCTATLEWRANEAAARTAGVLHRASATRLRMVPVSEPLRVQRRRFVRVQAELTAAVVADESQRVLARTLDVSVGGMLLTNADDLAVGNDIRFALDLGGATVSGGGRVVRATPSGERGVEFSDLPTTGERMLSRFVAERQRQKLALA